VLDGDGLRRGLNADLGSDPDHRAEGVRRVAHVAALLADAGTVVLISGVGLLAEERETARRIHAEAGPDLHEVAVDIELSVERMVDRVVELVT
jgi:bifunctional enzyme CysN/CysC